MAGEADLPAATRPGRHLARVGRGTRGKVGVAANVRDQHGASIMAESTAAPIAPPGTPSTGFGIAAAPSARGSAFLRRLRGAFDAGAAASHHYLLLFRFCLVNGLAAAAVAAAALQGWLAPMLAADTAPMVLVIVGVFLVGLVLCGRKVLQTSLELNQLKLREPRHGSRVGAFLSQAATLDVQGRANLASALKLKLANRIGVIRHIAGSLVFLGLIGTVIGFIIALSGVDPDAASDVDAVGPMVSTLISGMSVALYTTLVGSVLNIWLMMNYRMLESGTVNLVTGLVEEGEVRHA